MIPKIVTDFNSLGGKNGVLEIEKTINPQDYWQGYAL